MYIANQNAELRKNDTDFSELVDINISMRMQVALYLLLELLKADRIIISTLLEEQISRFHARRT
mgnify:CR=1 FL=1